ncbi:aspartic proteinase-like protein 1 isoform X1 [Cucurbita moschata]|uniref:Aspartic proteinase-like protein 1 isoform X1 n=1 Tax=Cucurbita moschata TaxID=3662 RepID=A0A6J1HE55_CUCMO|nr:aspartic proteinase-like protein 1 isoform X1 [Cucurbita moschata]
MSLRNLVLVLLMMISAHQAMSIAFTSRILHRFSEEMKALRVSRSTNTSVRVSWPEKGSMEYYQELVSGDFQRQKMKLGSRFQLLFPSEGSKTIALGNDFGWLHYAWIDIGTPSVSFLVALDAGSDLLWIPCDCIQCAPLSASYYGSLDKDLNEYRPSSSSTSKHISCSHNLCESGQSCQSPKQSCPYVIDYLTENTSSSGLLIQDVLHLSSGCENSSNCTIQAPVVLGCGMKQSGGYLSGVAPDGLFGLGLGEISVLSSLAKEGLVQNSFSLCFNEDGSGRIFFGDEGPASQQMTSFVLLDGKYEAYIVGVEACCIGNSCLEQTSFKALIDSGTSFTYLPEEVYENVVMEFDKRLNTTSTVTFKGYPWKYCYKISADAMPKVPSVTLLFPLNNSFVVHDPVFPIYGDQGLAGFCFAVLPTDGDIGILGQNYMTGYRMVFDRENLKLSWSRANCQDLSNEKKMPLAPSKETPPNPLPANEQQSVSEGHAVAPAVAGRAPSKPSAATPCFIPSCFYTVRLLHLLLLVFYLVSTCV